MSARPALAWIGASAIEGPSKAWAGLRQVLVSGGTSDDWADVLLDAKERPSPEVPPLKETLRSWKRRRILDSDVFERLADELKGRAGRLVDVWHTGFVEAVYGSLFDAMATGKTLAEWAEEAQSLLDQFGADAGARIFSGDRWSAWYADLVFRNANAAATAGGRYAEMFSREWIGRSPYWLYDALNDGRTRPEHAALDGLVFLKDDVTARRLLPPSAHNCRCAALELDEKDLAAGEYRVTESAGLSPDVFPGRGWDADRVESLIPATLRSVARGAA